MDESSTGESNPFVRRTWSWRHREGAVQTPNEVDLAYMELLSLDAEEIPTSPEDSPIGLSSYDAHRRLFAAIKDELDTFSESSGMRWTSDTWTTLNDNHHSCISWISLALLGFEICAMVITYAFSHPHRSSLPLLEGFIVLLITLTNLVVCIREENLRRTEIYRSAKDLMDIYKVPHCNWNPLDYVDPCTPSSPAISLVHTYRDNELISMPCNLLVTGDVIALGPSHTAPACVQLIENSSNEVFDEGSLQLKKGEMFNPKISNLKDQEEKTLPCQPYPRKRFLVQECPYRETLRNILRNSCSRPLSLLENEKHFIASNILERKVVWLILVLSLLVNVTRWLLLDNGAGDWCSMILLLQGYSILPLLPLAFPLLWNGLSLYGAARIKVMFDILTFSEIPGIKISRNIPMRDVLSYFWSNVRGDTSTLPRTTNLLQVLGNITVWCCVDKDGILSLPNPSVDKVFFLQSKRAHVHKVKPDVRDRKTSTCTYESDNSRQYSRDGYNTDEVSSSSSEDEEEDDDNSKDTHANDGVKVKDSHLKGRAAVLNVSSDPESQFGLRFDDKRWQDHLSSLKPLGLNILLNSPCSSPVRCLRLADCTAHLSLTYNPAPVPSHRRCLCLLGKEIGFMDRALNFFTKEQNIFAVQSSSIPVANFALQTSSYLAVCKERPTPSIACLLVKESYSGVHQLLTQGTADLVLDTCTDFWDGSNLSAITAHDRKKVLDFYQRNSMSSYCIAFSYRPVHEAPPGKADAFLQIPPIFQWTSGSESEGGSVSEDEAAADEEEDEGGISFSINDLSLEDVKVDSLFDNVQTVDDPDVYHRLLGGQVFIGMVTLQYQAKKDIIPLVEDLSKAGIRFVHFSAEDELKSRVFAERMGLETGWNCHISLADSVLQEDRSLETGTENKAGTAGVEPVVGEPGTEGDEKHVSWIDFKMQANVEESREGHGEADPGDESERTTLLSSQASARDDYWFFYNRAKLPRGVQNIRPHLENVDNVPLLVPLFTDSTPHAVQEMVAIMQEHGEVVCCTGSSFNVDNTGVFTQADMSIAIEPMFPQLCLKGLPKDFRSGTPQLAREHKRDQMDDSTSSDMDSEPTPLEVSAYLNSLPCSLAFHRNRDIKFKSLLKEARRLCFGLRTCFAFMLACQLILTAVNFVAQCLLLPPPLTGLHLLWLTCLTVPLLSLSLIGSRSEKEIMSMMTGRNDNKFQGMCHPFYLHFVIAFLPTCCFVSVVLFPLTLRGFCTKQRPDATDCHFLLGHRNSTEPWNGLGGSHRQALSLAQDVNAFFLVLFFAVTSTSFVHRLRSLWQRSPFTNRPWFCTVLIVVCVQVLFFALSQAFWTNAYGSQYSILDLPSYIAALIFAWPVCSLAVTELLKRRYIKLWIRYQRRAKLMFGTKLGMNSPF